MPKKPTGRPTGRPRKPNGPDYPRQCVVRLPAATADALEALAKARGCTVSDVIRDRLDDMTRPPLPTDEPTRVSLGNQGTRR